jgi:hypothetical protein
MTNDPERAHILLLILLGGPIIGYAVATGALLLSRALQ